MISCRGIWNVQYEPMSEEDGVQIFDAATADKKMHHASTNGYTHATVNGIDMDNTGSMEENEVEVLTVVDKKDFIKVAETVDRSNEEHREEKNDSTWSEDTKRMLPAQAMWLM